METMDMTTYPELDTSLQLLGRVLDSLEDSALIDRLWEYRQVGRQGYPIHTLWRAYVSSFILNLPHTNALIRRLEEDQDLRRICGFDEYLPHRSTFNRFIQRLANHSDLVDAILTNVTENIRKFHPDLGEHVAVDSTTVRTHSNPHRTWIRDSEASWTAKNSAAAKNEKEWRFGYKLHMIADANHEIPLGLVVKTAGRPDVKELGSVVEQIEASLSWFKPSFVIGDRGYDSQENHDYLTSKGIIPIILRRRPGNGVLLYNGIYTEKGVPTCLGGVPMEYIRSDPEAGWLFRCRAEGCHLQDSTQGMSSHCDTEVWEDPTANPHLFGIIRRSSPEWADLYGKRQAIERVFKSMKESRRLERHCVRGLAQVQLHALMSTLCYSTTILVKLRTGQRDTRWMVKRVG